MDRLFVTLISRVKKIFSSFRCRNNQSKSHNPTATSWECHWIIVKLKMITWHKIAFLCSKQHRHWTDRATTEKKESTSARSLSFASMRQLDECYHSPVTSDNISACSRIQENDEEGDFKRVWQRVIALSHSLLLSIRITPLIRNSTASFLHHTRRKKKR